MPQDADIDQTHDVEGGATNQVRRSLDVVGTTGGKVTLETIRQAAARKAAATKGPQGHQAAAVKAARTRKRKAAAAKASATKGPQGHRAAAAKGSATKGPQGHHALYSWILWHLEQEGESEHWDAFVTGFSTARGDDRTQHADSRSEVFAGRQTSGREAAPPASQPRHREDRDRRAARRRCGRRTLIWLAVGHLLGGPDEDDRTVLPFATASRHPGVAVAVASLTGEPLAPVGVLLAVVVSELAVVPYKRWRKRLRAGRSAVVAHPPTGAH